MVGNIIFYLHFSFLIDSFYGIIVEIWWNVKGSKVIDVDLAKLCFLFYLLRGARLNKRNWECLI